MTKEKNQAELEIEALADVFGIATIGFENFYKKCKEKSSGNSSKAASSGNYSTAASSGDYSACAAVGYRAAVKGDKGNLLMASEYINQDGKLTPVGGRVDIVDGKKLKAGRWYIVEGGKWVEVDFTDGVFSRVISNQRGIKKVKTDNGKVLYVVSDASGNSAHGETLKQAREDLIYKVVAKFDGKIPKSASGKEWIGIYRAATGACAAGVKHFVESTGKSLEETYTAAQIVKLVNGQYGAEEFAASVTRMNNAIGEASKGQSQALIDTFNKLGLSIAELMKLTPEQKFFEIARALNSIQNQAEFTNTGMEIFGRSFATLAPLIRESNGNLADFVEQQKKTGNALTEERLAKPTFWQKCKRIISNLWG